MNIELFSSEGNHIGFIPVGNAIIPRVGEVIQLPESNKLYDPEQVWGVIGVTYTIHDRALIPIVACRADRRARPMIEPSSTQEANDELSID